MKKKSFFLVLFTLVIANFSEAQRTFFIKDSRTFESMPFVKVFADQQNPFLSDIDGRFELPESARSVRLSFIEYADTTIDISTLTDSIIYMRKDIQEIQEVVVKPGENPAHRIIKQAQKNRKKNHPLKNDAFTYQSYSKFVFDVNKAIMVPENDDDTVTLKAQKYFDMQHLFVAESATKRTFSPPSKDKEEILAYKLSGLSDPSLSTFAQSMQSFNFYDNQFTILGESFMNPIASDGISRYLFILEDTLVNQSDTTYTIYFRPRKGKNFKGLEGRLYINTNGFAVEKVNASTYRSSGQFDVQIIQEYEFINGTKWFPVKLSTDLSFGEIEIENKSQRMITGTGHTYIDSIVINPEEKPKEIYNNIDLYTSEDAGELEESEWEELRTYKLSEKEARTHSTVDSIAKANDVERKMGFIRELAEGRIRLGYVSIPLERLFYYNQFEGYRLGAGLETSSKLSKVIKVGGYAGWGTKDHKWKYGGYSTIHLKKRSSTKMELLFQEDVVERGGMRFKGGGFDLNNTDLLRSFFIEQMEYRRKAEVSFSTDLKANINIRLFGNYQRVRYSDDYTYYPGGDWSEELYTGADLAELGAEIKWNIGEKYMLLGDTKVSQGLKYPSIKFQVRKGIRDLWESNYDYWRMNASISQKIKFRDYATLSLSATANNVIGDVPLFLTHNGKGTRADWMIDVENTFQTMFTGSYYSTEQVAFFTRLKLKPLHTKAKWNEPGVGFHHAIGYGNFVNRTHHNTAFETMEQGYAEAGLILDNLLILNKVSGFGIGLFYRYDSNADPDSAKNIVPKITMNFVF